MHHSDGVHKNGGHMHVQEQQGRSSELAQELTALKDTKVELQARVGRLPDQLKAAQRSAGESFVNMRAKNVRSPFAVRLLVQLFPKLFTPISTIV